MSSKRPELAVESGSLVWTESGQCAHLHSPHFAFGVTGPAAQLLAPPARRTSVRLLFNGYSGNNDLAESAG